MPSSDTCGGGERKTLRLAARYADESNVIARSPEEVAHKRDVLRRHCDEAGRDPAEVKTSVLYTGDALANGEISRFVDDVRPYARLGVETMIVMPLVADPVAFVNTRYRRRPTPGRAVSGALMERVRP